MHGLNDTLELRESFSSYTDWLDWKSANGSGCASFSQRALKAIKQSGFREPLTGIQRKPEEILINEEALRESISSNGLNSRKRALLLQIEANLRESGWPNVANLRILSADGISRIALILRGMFPYFWGAEYLPNELDRKQFFPMPHMDLQEIDMPSESFDMFVSGDVFEHIPDLDKALAEIHRVLKLGGTLVSSFPFHVERLKTEIRAEITPEGKTHHILPAEYHGNPVDPENGTLVFSLPGWDILEKLRNLGFSNARMRMIASAEYGVLSNTAPGPLILVATRG